MEKALGGGGGIREEELGGTRESWKRFHDGESRKRNHRGGIREGISEEESGKRLQERTSGNRNQGEGIRE